MSFSPHAGNSHTGNSHAGNSDVGHSEAGNSEAGASDNADLLGSAALLAWYFENQFGLAGWGDAPAPEPYPSGPVPEGPSGLGARRLRDPEARFHYAMMMSEVMLMPMCVAHSAREKRKYNAEIAQVLGLDDACARGWIAAFVICWPSGSFPRTADRVRILTAPGRRSRAQVLGQFEKHIRRFVDSRKRPIDLPGA